MKKHKFIGMKWKKKHQTNVIIDSAITIVVHIIMEMLAELNETIPLCDSFTEQEPQAVTSEYDLNAV